MQITPTHLEALSVPAPYLDGINEDAWLALESATPPGRVIAAVIDGASARLTIPRLGAALQNNYRGISAATFASSCVRTSLVRQLSAHPNMSLVTALLTANQDLQAAIAEIIGGFSVDHILEITNSLADDDPRRVRLALPACVATLMRLNHRDRQLEYAHAGDTSLLEIRRSGQVIRHTSDQMGPYDQLALRLAAHLKQEQNLAHIRDAVDRPEVQQTNLENGLWHNYVDDQGKTHPDKGCGVIDGLPELADYIERGTITVDPEQTEGFCVLSDGLELLAPLEETPAQTESRLRQTGALLRTKGLPGLFEAMQKMAESDPYFDQYPRMKAQDDATGVYLRLSI